MLTSALSAFFINSENISVNEYKNVIANQPKYKIEKNIYNNLILSEKDKKQINNDLSSLIEFKQKYISIHRKVFINNFDKWVIEESDSILSLVNFIINTSKVINREYTKLKKPFKNYPSITSKLDELINLNNEIIDFTKNYLARANKADEAYKFINNFIPMNQEVLKALA